MAFYLRFNIETPILKVMNETALTLQDHFLIAMPSMVDYHFNQSVVYVCAHSEEGTMGVVVNHPIADIQLGEVLAQMKITSDITEVNSQAVFLGGPVQPERGFIIHRPNKMWQSTLVTSDDLGVTSSQDILEAIATGEGPHDTIIILGYAGWGAGQVEEEISRNSWISVKAEPGIIFNTPHTSRWQAALSLLGIDPNQLSSESGHA